MSVVNALHETIAPGMGLNPKDIKIGIIHEDGPYGTDVAATEKKRAGAGLHGGRGAALFRQDGGPVLAHPAPEGRQGDVVLQTAYQNDAILFFSQARAAASSPRS